MNSSDMEQWFRDSYGSEYTDFLLIHMGRRPRVCPVCGETSIRTLWIADPTERRRNSFWAKWYLWCSACLTGIYCPLGTYILPVGEEYVLWRDEDAIRKALPESLRLIAPTYVRARGPGSA